VSDCCLTSSYILMRWWWFILCSRPPHLSVFYCFNSFL